MLRTVRMIFKAGHRTANIQFVTDSGFETADNLQATNFSSFRSNLSVLKSPWIRIDNSCRPREQFEKISEIDELSSVNVSDTQLSRFDTKSMIRGE